jgi:hypothetical protein
MSATKEQIEAVYAMISNGDIRVESEEFLVPECESIHNRSRRVELTYDEAADTLSASLDGRRHTTYQHASVDGVEFRPGGNSPWCRVSFAGSRTPDSWRMSDAKNFLDLAVFCAVGEWIRGHRDDVEWMDATLTQEEQEAVDAVSFEGQAKANP